MLAESTAAHTASESQSSVRISLVVLSVKTSVLWKKTCVNPVEALNMALMNFVMIKSFLIMSVTGNWEQAWLFVQ